MGGTPGKWNTAPKKGGEVLPSPAAAALLPGTVSLGLGPVEAVGGGSRTALCLLFARACTSVLLGILGCQAANFRLSLISLLGTCPCHVAATCFASLLLPVTFPRARGSTQGCSVPEAALPTSPHVVGLIKVSVFCTGDCVGLSDWVCSCFGSRASKASGRSLRHREEALWTHLLCRWLTSCLH